MAHIINQPTDIEVQEVNDRLSKLPFPAAGGICQAYLGTLYESARERNKAAVILEAMHKDEKIIRLCRDLILYVDAGGTKQ